MEHTVKEIGVALSSSVNEFQAERQELGNFIRFLNEHIYKQRKVHLNWYVCEDESGAITPERRQEVFNAQIGQSRFFFLLVGRHIGQYTREEFDVALTLFNASRDRPEPEARNIPKIFPYFKEMPHEARTAEAHAFREYLHSDVNGGQYSLKYNHLDTLKLRMLMEFGRDMVLGGKVTVEDETARMDGQPVTDINVGKIPAYANHRNLKRLRQQKAKLDAEFAELSLLYHAGDAEAGKERLLVSEERNELSAKIHAIEDAVLDAFNLVTEMAQGRQTERAEAAARLLEAGEYEQAQAVLQSVDSPEIQADWHQAEQIMSTGQEMLRKLIQENRLRIQALYAQGVNKETLSQLEACYKQSTDEAQKYHIEPEVVYDYARFLEEQADYLRAIDLCEWLEMEYQQIDVPPKTWAALWNLLGVCHSENKNFQKGELYFRNALERYRVLAKANPDAFANNVAIVCNNLAELLRNTREYGEAETLYREALKHYRILAETNFDAFAQYVAMTCNNLAILLKNTGEYKEAGALFREALEIRRSLAKINPAAFLYDVAQTYNNLANLLSNMGKYEEAKILCRKALKICRSLAETNSDAFVQYVATTCNNLANLLRNTGEYKEAEALYREALKIRRILFKTNSEAFAADVANNCNNLANLLSDIGKCEEAQALYWEALEIHRKLVKSYPSVFLPYMASTCFNLGLFELENRHNRAAAKKYLQDALSIYEQFPYLAQDAAQTRRILENIF